MSQIIKRRNKNIVQKESKETLDCSCRVGLSMVILERKA